MPGRHINPPYMHGYKYPAEWSRDQKRRSSLQNRNPQRKTENRRLKMLCSRCALPFLTLYFFLEEISAAVLPNRNKRDVNLLDQDLFPRLPDRSDDGDLSVGDAGEVVRDSDSHKSHSETAFVPTENHQRQNHQYQYNRKANEKRRKVAPLDSIGSFKMSNSRNRKDEPDDLEDFME